MQKTILVTGATDGIGLATAKMLIQKGHNVLLHGRNPEKLETVVDSLSDLVTTGSIDSYVADLSEIKQVAALATAIAAQHKALDVLINNAGVFRMDNPITAAGLDARFVVNTLAPYLLTRRVLPLMNNGSRIVNLSSAAQAPVNLDALRGTVKLDPMDAYAQSKLAITSWSHYLAAELGDTPVVVAVNPASLLGSKMVKEGFGVDGGDLRIGADILVRAALSDEFANASGQYFDNDTRRFATPHPDAFNPQKSAELVKVMEAVLATQ